MGKISVSDIIELSVPERILLVEEVWDSIAEIPEAVPLTSDQRVELDRRVEAYYRNENAGSPWEEVKNRILSTRGER